MGKHDKKVKKHSDSGESIQVEVKNKKKIKKKKENTYDDSESLLIESEDINLREGAEKTVDNEAEKIGKKKDKIRDRTESHFQTEDVQIEVKNKKKIKKKKEDICDDSESPLIQSEDINLRDGAEKVTKKKGKIRDRTESHFQTEEVVNLKDGAEKTFEDDSKKVKNKMKKPKIRDSTEPQLIQTEDVIVNDGAEKVKTKKKRDIVLEECVTEAEGGEKKKRKKKRKSGEYGLGETVHEVEEGSKHKKRAKSVNDTCGGENDKESSLNKTVFAASANLSENPKSKKTSKKVRFASEVETFPSSDDMTTSKKHKNRKGLVQGKRFTPEEDEMLRAAVTEYIERHALGEDGIDKIMFCSRHRETKKCWHEIALAIPWRPRAAVYHRGRNLFSRSEERGWTTEEFQDIRNFHAEHGPDWTTLAQKLGKHRIHVKDVWRRIKLTDKKKGRWSQDEYQGLFDCVNMDLQMKVFEEKKSKHGMLRDNICWEAISDKLSTRIGASLCKKWYNNLSSSLVAEGKWADTDDYRLVYALYNLDACCMEDVDWDNLLEHRDGDVCRQRWKQMVKYIGEHGNKLFAEQVEVLMERYRPDLLEAREEYANRPAVDEEGYEDE